MYYVRTLIIHAEEFWFKVREKAVAGAEELATLPSEASLSNALVVFVTVEPGDPGGGKAFLEEVANDIADIYNRVSADVAVIYPYAHLSKKLAPPHEAIEVLKGLEEALRGRSVNVVRTPFGWYKAFRIKCLGHPLSELSREYAPEGVRARRALQKEFYVVKPSGEVVRAEDYVPGEGEEGLRILIDKEVLRKELPGGEPRIVNACRKFGFEWEPLSDPGHMRYGPHATVMLEAVMEYSWLVAKSLGFPVFRVRGTNMFNLKFRPVKEHADLFGDRLYEIESDGDRLVLRYAACHQQFAMIKDWVISYRELPFGAFEVADSYRYEQRGETMLCFRLRKFLMPDLHIFTKDLEEAKKVALQVQAKIIEEARKIGHEYFPIYNVTKDFFEGHRDYIVELIRREGRPALVEVIPSGIYYWVLNIEYNIIDSLKRPREIATFQIDVGNAKRFGIRFVDEGGEERYPVIIHTAIIGSIERFIYAVLDRAIRDEELGRTPTLPTWLSPIQVRVIPVSSQYMDYAEEVLRRLINEGIRADLDDRALGLGRKIRDAGIEWIPYIVVVGAREVKTRTVNVRVRSEGVQKSIPLEELVELVKREVVGYPQVDTALPTHLSRRPTLNYIRSLAQ